MLTHAFIIPLIMAVSFLVILAFGKRLPRGGAEVGIAAVAICFILAIATGVGWIQRTEDPPAVAHTEEAAAHGEEGAAATDEHATEGDAEAEAVESSEGHGEEAAEEHHAVPPVIRNVTWLQTGGHEITVGTMVDGLTAMMLFVVTLISMLVHVYSSDYVAGDRRFTHYYAFLSLFTASMLMFVLTENTLQLIVGWELVGLCSFVLIGHWWEEKPNSDAALKAFLTNRVGDIGLLVGMITLYFGAGGTFDITTINTMANAGEIDHLLLLVSSLCLLTAVMSKSGQFILHTWLPDAMAGPTPVSALIHAATMVVAGIYMVARLYPVFWHGLSIGSANINALAVVGTVTLFFGALLAFVQSDIKKVLAYSTVSQLGFMVMALGVGAWTAAVFHLFTHAMFKACLFLGAGSMSHACHHSFDMKKDYGNLRKHMPRTFWTFMIATAALMGIPGLAGFWSKDEILAGASQLGGDGNYKIMLVGGILGAMCTAAYMTRAIWYCFFGEERGAAKEHTPHESGPLIVVPLIILAFLALIAGFANLPNSGVLSFVPDSLALRFEHYVEPTTAAFPSTVVTGAEFDHPEFSLIVAVVSSGLAILTAVLTYLWYWKGKGPQGITQRNKVARLGYTILENKYYFDWLYTTIIVGAIKGPIARGANWINKNVLDGIVNGVGTSARESGKWVYDHIDQGIVDTLVNGSGAGAEGTGQLLRKQQNGKVQTYGAYLFGAATILAAVFVVIASELIRGEIVKDLLNGWGLSAAAFLPLVGAAVIMVIPRTEETLHKIVALVTSLAVFAVGVALALNFDYDLTGDLQFVVDKPWIDVINSNYIVGIDGMSLPLLLLTVFIVPLVVIYSWDHFPEPHNPKAFLVLILILETGMVGTFIAQDLILFFVFFEVVLLPMYFMIGVWGGEQRQYASIKFFLYTLFGSALMIVAFLSIYFLSQQNGVPAADAFDMRALTSWGGAGLASTTAILIFGGMFMGFGIKVPMFPFHTWLPDAHTEAPTQGSVILAAVLLKLGTYGFIRVAIPILPEAAESWAPWIGGLAVVGIIYGALGCLAQTDMKRLIAFSSVAHMGYVMLGIATLTDFGLNAAIFGMVAHGLITGMLFFLAGSVKERYHTLEISRLGGLLTQAPHMGWLLGFSVMASLGLPGLAGFWGEFPAILSAYEPGGTATDALFRVYMVIAAIGTVLAAGYLLWLLQRVAFGTPKEEFADAHVHDMHLTDYIVWTPMIVLIVVLGVYPDLLFSVTDGAVVQSLSAVAAP